MFKAWQSHGRQEAMRHRRGHRTGRTRAGKKNDDDKNYDDSNDDDDDDDEAPAHHCRVLQHRQCRPLGSSQCRTEIIRIQFNDHHHDYDEDDDDEDHHGDCDYD